MSFIVNICRMASAVALTAGVVACAGVVRPVRDAISPPGEKNADGSINPCHGYKADPQACGLATYNSARIGKIALGQSLQEVRAIMGKDPEERSVKSQDGRSLETWGYRTDYRTRITTRIEFIDLKVVAIRQDRT